MAPGLSGSYPVGMKSFLVAAAVLAAGPSFAETGRDPGVKAVPAGLAGAAAAGGLSGAVELTAQIDAWSATELPRTEPPDPLTLRYKPRADLIRAQVQAAREPRDLDAPRKDFEEWKTAVLREKFALAPADGRVRGFSLFLNDEAERARSTAAMSAMMAQLKVRQSVLGLAGRAPAADGAKFFDGGVAMSPEAVAAAPSQFADVPSGPARYAKIRALLLHQGVDKRVVDAAIAEGVRQNVDPALVLAVVWKESGFKRTAHNAGSDATGLMQLLPDTAKQMGVRNGGMLYDIRTNIRAGVRYLKWIANDYFHMHADLSDVTRVSKSNLDAILASYNGGIGNVSKWLRRQGGRLKNIPFAETREYVKLISDKIASWI